MSFKEDLYDNYVSSHILPRKGKATIDDFELRSILYGQQFGKYLPQDKNARILDLGCGNGSVVWWLKKIGYKNATGIDISGEQIEVGKKIGVIDIEQADIKEYLSNNNISVDTFFLRDVLEHFPKEDIYTILKLCYKSLNCSGKIIIQSPNAESPFSGRFRYGDFTHEVSFTSSSLNQLMMSCGFQKVSTHAAQPPIHNTKSLVRFLLWKFLETIYKLILCVEVGGSRKIVTNNIIAIAFKNKPVMT